MFRPHRPRSPFADFIDWTDYRVDGPFGAARYARAPWRRRRTHPLVKLLMVLALIWFVNRLMRGRRDSAWF